MLGWPGIFEHAVTQKSYDWRSHADGDTFYAGNRNSGRLMRVYNRRGPVRLELELKKRFAKPFVRNLMLNGFQCLLSESIGVLRAMLDFIDTDDDKNKSRAKLLPWWQALVKGAERIQYSTITKDDSASIEEMKLRQYYDRLKPTLFIISEVLGCDIKKDVNCIESTLKAHHRSKILPLRPNHLIPSDQNRDMS